MPALAAAVRMARSKVLWLSIPFSVISSGADLSPCRIEAVNVVPARNPVHALRRFAVSESIRRTKFVYRIALPRSNRTQSEPVS